ncbi:MAG: hypothetical protein IJF87_05910 [Erysipelotrichaceae bacterium]|nr:hypothetical protein [Erysipelotrichaceae bacterium]
MIVIKELIYFIYTLFLLTVLLCLQILSGWLLNTLFKELLDIDVVSIMKLHARKKKQMPKYTEFKGDWIEYQQEKEKRKEK